ncbi:hypothetical protein CRG98_018531 [Punica granatum]|uniref:Uncharacterized protein n=1 Tax=Punica granatum TaxID=22663 RepID=A0A2I0K051_PUNGR|nr:hypothetical protein CRG98_018531 [Punica granatum]
MESISRRSRLVATISYACLITGPGWVISTNGATPCYYPWQASVAHEGENAGGSWSVSSPLPCESALSCVSYPGWH